MSTARANLTGRRSVTERIEQAIARGHSVPRIAADLGIDQEQVHRAWDRLDEAVTEPDVTVSLIHRERPEIGPRGQALRPHGTHAAFRRHRDRGEKPCAECEIGERRYNTEQKRLRRGAAA